MWPLLVLTLSVREDAGFHVACALAPLLYLNRPGRGDSATRRDVVQLIGFAVGWSALAFAVQKVFLSPPPAAWRMAFFGNPPFFHIGAAALRERVGWLATGCSHITVPFVATVILACARRDARYLLGWLAATPWLVANLLAFEDAKWRLSAYVGFPFLISVFWGYLYGGVLASPSRRLARTAADLFFAAAFLTSTGAVYLQYPHLVRLVVRGGLRMDPASPEQVDAFAKAINGRGTALGRLAVDAPVAALAIETLPRGGGFDPGKLEIDTVAFHREGNVDAASLLLGLSANGIVHCAHVLATGYYLCSRFDGATARLLGVRTEAVPPLLVFANFDVGGRRIEFAPEGVAIGRSSAPGLTVASFAMSLRAGGSYEVVWDLAVDAATEPSGRTTIATVDVVVDQQVVGDGAAVAGDGLVQRIVVPFSVGANKAFSARLWYHGPAGLVVRSAQLRSASPR